MTEDISNYTEFEQRLARGMNERAYAEHEASWAKDKWPVFLPHARTAIEALVEMGVTLTVDNQLTAREERLTEAMGRIAQWAGAYPTTVFPVPDDDYMQRAHEVLKAHGMTIDRISADAMRHVLYGIGRIARAALKEDQHAPE
jgi:hypothetical protein